MGEERQDIIDSDEIMFNDNLDIVIMDSDETGDNNNPSNHHRRNNGNEQYDDDDDYDDTINNNNNNNNRNKEQHRFEKLKRLMIQIYHQPLLRHL